MPEAGPSSGAVCGAAWADKMVQPVALGERIVALSASLARMLRLAEGLPAYAFPDPIERQRALDEARDVLLQHKEFEAPFRPLG